MRAVTDRVRRSQKAADGFPDRIVDYEAVAPGVDERQLAQALDCLRRISFVEHRTEQRLGRAANDRRSLERAPGQWILDVLQVDARELIDHASAGGLLELQVGLLGDPGHREGQRQGMAGRDPSSTLLAV